MGVRIFQLPPAIANQIAAGEVIERPASVVKELLENSLDAGADVIHIDIGYGGLNQIKISDNGSGIVADDLPLAIAAHATSKIKTLNDLYSIDSMGFRGEALASIASVAKLKISSKTKEQDHAMMLSAFGMEYSISPCARATGTTIDVVDLFFNAPVRKRFLKSERLEFQAIEQVVKRFALSAPHIALSLNHNNKLVLSLPAALNDQAKQQRMLKLFGSAFIKDAIHLDVEHAGMHLYGWVSGPLFQRSQNDRQWVYINQRMVKDKLINHALKQAYDGLLYPGRFPACLLYFNMKHAEVDVNVHPTKHEVRFQQPRLVRDFFVSQLKNALASECIEPMSTSEEGVYEPQALFQHHLSEPAPYHQRTFSSDRPKAQGRSSAYNVHSFVSNEHPWIVLNKQYSILFIDEMPYVFDVAAVYAACLLKKIKQELLPLPSRPLLVPLSYPAPQGAVARLSHLADALEQLGIQIASAKEGELLIRKMPVCMPYLDFKRLIVLILEQDVSSAEQLMPLLVQAQTVDAALFAQEERSELSQFIIQEQGSQASMTGILKALTLDDCRNLVHV